MLNSNWVTIQFFVSDNGVFEVTGHQQDYRKMRCTCPDFSRLTRCKHVKFSREKIAEDDGVLSLKIPEDVTDEEMDAMVDGQIELRDLLLRYGKVVYIP